jgi:hypothetical protein
MDSFVTVDDLSTIGATRTAVTRYLQGRGLPPEEVGRVLARVFASGPVVPVGELLDRLDEVARESLTPSVSGKNFSPETEGIVEDDPETEGIAEEVTFERAAEVLGKVRRRYNGTVAIFHGSVVPDPRNPPGYRIRLVIGGAHTPGRGLPTEVDGVPLDVHRSNI